MAAMLISTGVNLVLAIVFVMGLDMGIRGAALATDCAMFTAMVFVMWHFVQRDSVVHFRRGIYGLRWPVIISIISIGAAPALVNAVGCLINIVLNNKLKTFGGDMAIGAAGLFTTYTQLIVMVVIGICQGMQPIVGYNYGAGKFHRMKRAYRLAVAAASVLCCLGAAIGIDMPRMVARIFNPDPELIAATERCLQLALLAFFVVGYQIVSTNFFQSIGKAGKSILLSLSRQAIFLIPLLLWLPSQLGLNGIWLSFPISDILATLVTYVLMRVQFRQLSRLEKCSKES